MRTPLVAGGATAALLIGLAAGSASMSGMTITAPPGAAQAALTGATVTNSLRDRFTVATAVPLDGQVSDFDGGAGFTADSGPTWSADSTWSNPAGDYVIRDSGAGLSTARVAWLSRHSTVGMRVSNYSGAVAAGVLIGGNAAGTSGLAAVLFDSGGLRFGLFRIDAGSPTACSSLLNLNGNPARTITITYDPSTAGTASATISGGGGGTVTSTCSLTGINGAYAGLYSNSATTTRYDNFSATL